MAKKKAIKKPKSKQQGMVYPQEEIYPQKEAFPSPPAAPPPESFVIRGRPKRGGGGVKKPGNDWSGGL